MNRGELEDAIEDALHRVQHGALPIAAGVDEILEAFDAHRAPVITLPEDAPVHFQLSPGRPACHPRGRPIAGRLTTTPGRVTCGNCHRSPAWRSARAQALALREPWELALDEFLGEAR